MEWFMENQHMERLREGIGHSLPGKYSKGKGKLTD